MHSKTSSMTRLKLHEGLHPKKILSHKNSNCIPKKELSNVQCSIML